MPFQWPWQYDFPPFFTIQPNLSSREKQLEAWARLIIDYCQFHNIHSLDLNEVAKSEIFNNTRINRSLNEAGIRTVFDYLEEKEHIEWTDKTKKRCRIYWRRPEEWGELLYEWASSNGLLNTVITLTDIIEGEDTANESFAGLEKPILIRAIESLQSQRRAVLVELNNEIGGVKFL
uniref:Vacuolar protein-sorting-associated protein 25 n=1 Tax=Acrobeloides nanus TaxID=290746 RepID=A0A914CWY6_9BILA